MRNQRQKLAALICSGYTMTYRNWLAQEAGDLALKISGLDEVSPEAILPLLYMAANGVSNARTLTSATGIEESELQDHLKALCDFEFVVDTGNGYMATPSGEQVFKAISRNMVIRERLELQRRLSEVEQLFQRLNDD